MKRAIRECAVPAVWLLCSALAYSGVVADIKADPVLGRDFREHPRRVCVPVAICALALGPLGLVVGAMMSGGYEHGFEWR